MISSNKLAKKLAKVIIKYRAQPHTALEACLYTTFGVASMMGMDVDDMLEIIKERKSELDGHEKDDAHSGDTQLDACGDEPVCDGGG